MPVRLWKSLFNFFPNWHEDDGRDPDGFYIEEDYFETWMAENNKSLASSGSLTLSSRGAIDTIDL